MNIGKRRDEGVAILTSLPGGVVKDAVIGSGTIIKGTLTFSGPAEIYGNIEGEIIAKDRLKIGEGAVVTARISGSEIEVCGTVTGDISATGKLILRKPAKVTSNLIVANLTIEDGVVFEGSCTMKNAPQLAVTKATP